MAESRDLSEVDDREHYQRRRARQGNKPTTRSKKVTSSKQPATKSVKKSLAAKKAEAAAKQLDEEPSPIVVKKKPGPVSRMKKTSSNERHSLSTDLSTVKVTTTKKPIGKKTAEPTKRPVKRRSASSEIMDEPPAPKSKEKSSASKRAKQAEKPIAASPPATRSTRNARQRYTSPKETLEDDTVGSTRKNIKETVSKKTEPPKKPSARGKKAKTDKESDKSSSTSKSSRQWSDAELDRLKRAVIQVPTKDVDYWQAVANFVQTRSKSECLAVYNERPDIQKSTYCNLVLDKLITTPSSQLGSPNHSPKKQTRKQTKPKKAVTAGAGTRKRREQIRNIVEENAADKWNPDANEFNGSHNGGGLTQSEKEDLLGGDLMMITPSAGPASSSMITAGGQALSRLDSMGPSTSMISSSEVPNAKDRQDADKIVSKIRANAKTKKKNAVTVTKGKITLFHCQMCLHFYLF